MLAYVAASGITMFFLLAALPLPAHGVVRGESPESAE
jgi:hypothetical protein